MKVSTIVNYCTRHDRYFDELIKRIKPFCNHIIVVVSNKFFDGYNEDLILIQKRMNQYKDLIWLLTDFDTYNHVPQYAKAWHSRYLAFHHLQENENTKSDYVLFLDADEFLETELFTKFIEKIEWGANYRFSNYVYFREPIYRAKTLEYGVVMMFTHNLDINTVYQSDRPSLFTMSKGPKYDNFIFDNQVMIHHFSWVGTKDQLLTKIKGWGHASDRDWKKLIEDEFSHDFNGTDFINHHQYETIENPIVC